TCARAINTRAKIAKGLFKSNAKISANSPATQCKEIPARRTSLIEPGLRGMYMGGNFVAAIGAENLVEEPAWI
ncbi:MAG TPA: hypothetical protein VMI06_04255, partial [Terriglobia bacterium]|nr:hypothetical protein [Terriglobia bacterium]